MPSTCSLVTPEKKMSSSRFNRFRFSIKLKVRSHCYWTTAANLYYNFYIIFYCSKIPRPQLFFSDQSNTHILLISKVLTDYLPTAVLNPPLGLGYQGLTFLMGLGQKIAPKGNPPLYNHCFQSQKYVKEIVFSDQTWQVGWHLSQTNTRRGACYICPTGAKVWVDSARKLK